MKASTATSIGAMALVMASTVATAAGNLRLRRALASTRRQLGEARYGASHDALTGLANRRGVEASLAARMSSGSPWALIMIDLDGFKPVNDTYGHAAGDSVLAEAARRLSSVVNPATDLVGRLGGDEFAILAESAFGPISMMLARDAVTVLRRTFAIGDARVEVTASVGWVQVMPGDDPRAVMHSADAALYRAKAAGGNTAVEFGPNEPLANVEVERPKLRVRDRHSVPSDLAAVIAS